VAPVLVQPSIARWANGASAAAGRRRATSHAPAAVSTRAISTRGS
jgi:hypothetical protein